MKHIFVTYIIFVFIYSINHCTAQNDSVSKLFTEYETAVKHNAKSKTDKINTEIIAQKTLEVVYQTKNIDLLTKYYNTFAAEEKYAAEAKRIRDKMAFENAQGENTLSAYQNFLLLYPDASQTILVKSLIEQKLLQYYCELKNVDSLMFFAYNVSDKNLSTKAFNEAEKITFERALIDNTAENYSNYLAKYPTGTYAAIAKDKYNRAVINENLKDYKVSSLISFLINYPTHPAYKDLLDTLGKIALEYFSFRGKMFYDNNIMKDDSSIIEWSFTAKNGKTIPIPQKQTSLYKIEILTNYINNPPVNINVSELKTAFVDTDFHFFNNQHSVLFISNREDGYGTDNIKLTKQDTLNTPFDIYTSSFVNEHWATPTLLPRPVNNEFTQQKPFLSNDKKILFFSANYPETYGGVDIYLSYRSDTNNWLNWSEPFHLNYEFNSKSNDYVMEFNSNFIIINSSNGQYRKLSTKNNNKMFNFCSGYAKNIDNKPSSAQILLVDNVTTKEISETKSNNTGFFAFIKPENKYSVIGLAKGCIPTMLVNTESLSDTGNIMLQLNEINSLIARNKMQQLDIFFDTNDLKKLNKVSKLYLNYLAKELIPLQKIITISVYCQKDIKDLSATNLAQMQANIIKSTLIEAGLSSEKIVAVGFEDKKNSNISYDNKENSHVEIGFIDSNL
ncbi:MAG: hypothetical protein LBR28_02720 [Bacteroidales bacterium]|jgi:hypothetical protein|nr:hypothetical protein [Bacteroidales bacterium]